MLLIGFVIFVLILWIYSMQFADVYCPQVFIDDLIDSHVFKTGDMILFKASNNYNSIIHGGYFGHIGIVFVDLNGTPYLFEANGIEKTPLRKHHSKSGIYFTPLEDRIKKYKGRCFLKSLNKELSTAAIDDFTKFIAYALKNMYYNYSVLKSGIKKGLGIEKCLHGTNCGEIVFLSLIVLGLLPVDVYDKCVFHHLRWMYSIRDLSDGYFYHDLIEIIDHPFAK